MYCCCFWLQKGPGQEILWSHFILLAAERNCLCNMSCLCKHLNPDCSLLNPIHLPFVCNFIHECNVLLQILKFYWYEMEAYVAEWIIEIDLGIISKMLLTVFVPSTEVCTCSVCSIYIQCTSLRYTNLVISVAHSFNYTCTIIYMYILTKSHWNVW